jgi:RNA recognition motif-containing protein
MFIYYRLLKVFLFSLSLTVNLVMDKVAKRPRGFAFLRYETEEEAQKAIEGMHGKVCSRCHFLRELYHPI